MKWRGRERSRNIEDRRARRPRGGLGGGFGRGGGLRFPAGGGSRGGLGGLIGVGVILALIWLTTGQNPLDMLISDGGGPVSGPAAGSSAQSLPAPDTDELAGFVGVVVKETENLWTDIFAASGQDYPEPVVVLFSDQIKSGCGLADASVGPFYCPADSKVYIDLSFYDQLRRHFGAPGDVAQAYVLAHEVGHHIQNLTGVLPDFNRRRRSMSQQEANAHSVRVELQADCYAGVWANYAGRRDLLERGDVEEALNAANQIGDDTLQKRMQGFAVPKTFNHGTSAQRQAWFARGYRSGDPNDCDTFSGPV